MTHYVSLLSQGMKIYRKIAGPRIYSYSNSGFKASFLATPTPLSLGKEIFNSRKQVQGGRGSIPGCSRFESVKMRIVNKYPVTDLFLTSTHIKSYTKVCTSTHEQVKK